MKHLNSILLACAVASAPLGVAAGLAGEFGLEPIGQLRVHSSQEIDSSRWGVSCCWIADEHPLSVEQRLDHLSATGAKWALLVPDWNRIEQRKGTYDWNTPEHRLDDVIKGLVKRKIAPVVQIYGGNRLYMQTAPDANNRPRAEAAKLLGDSEIRKAWLHFVEALVLRYKEQVKVWEIWNEPNGDWFWAKSATVAEYGRMAKEVAAVIQRVQPGAVILAGATANVPLDFLEGFLASEGAGSFQHWSVHPYGELPEAREPAIQAIQNLLRAQGKSPLVWQSECGIPSSPDTGGWGFGGPWDETKQAKWLLRRLLSDARLGMPVSIYFVLHDYPAELESGPDKGKVGINRKGLYRHGSWEPKAAARAFAHLSSLLDDRFELLTGAAEPVLETGTAAAPKDAIKSCCFKQLSSGQTALVYWLGMPMETRFEPMHARVTMPVPAIENAVLVDLLDGKVYELPHREKGGQLGFDNLPLSDSPLVLCSRAALELKP